jgi:hypothetical protein
MMNKVQKGRGERWKGSKGHTSASSSVHPCGSSFGKIKEKEEKRQV